MKISTVILAKNSSSTIIQAISSAYFSDEILLIDDESDDNTVNLIQQLKNNKIKIITHKLKDFSSQRNKGLAEAKNEWVLFLDSDEVVSSDLAAEIKTALSKKEIVSKFVGFKMRRIDYQFGKYLIHGDVGNKSFIRMGQKEKGTWKGLVHEKWDLAGTILSLKNPIIHFPHHTIKEFTHEINRYSSLRARELFEQKVKSGFFSIISYPLFKFVYIYFIKKGFLDGEGGLLLTLFMSFYSFLVRAKLWQLWKK